MEIDEVVSQSLLIEDSDARYGDSVLERFLSKVVQGENQCIEWIGGKNKDGYGRFDVPDENGKWSSELAHRWVFEYFICLELLSYIQVCHHCDNPGCVNPAHLFVGSHTDNMVDKARKGRANGLNHYSKLTPAQRKEIQDSDRPTKELVAEYGINRSHVQRLRSGKTSGSG